MPKPKRKKFNVWMQLFVQGSAFIVEMIGGWYVQKFSPEAWEAMKPHVTELMGSVHGMVLAYSGARVAMSNTIKKAEAKKTGELLEMAAGTSERNEQ